MNANEATEMVAGEQLNTVILMDLMKKVNNQFNDNQVDIMTFTAMYSEWLKLFKHLGKALVVAFKGKQIEKIFEL